MHEFTVRGADDDSTARESVADASAPHHAGGGPSAAASTHRGRAEALVREAMKSRARAIRFVSWKGFDDIAQDAVQEALLILARRAEAPAFVPPISMRAWLFRWSVCSAHVLRRDGDRLDVVSFDAAVEAFAHACNVAAEEDAASPDARLDADADAATLDAWRDRVGAARESLLPQDRAVLDAELARDAAGAVADAAHRKRLQRARRRASVVLGRHGIHSARPPAPMR